MWTYEVGWDNHCFNAWICGRTFSIVFMKDKSHNWLGQHLDTIFIYLHMNFLVKKIFVIRRLFQIGVATKTFYSLDYCGPCFFMIWTRIVNYVYFIMSFINIWMCWVGLWVASSKVWYQIELQVSIKVWGPLYTRSQGQCSTQIKHSYWWKSWNQPQGLYTRRQGWNRKNLFNLRQVTNKCWTLPPWYGPKAEKRIPYNLGSQFATLGVQYFSIY